MANDPMELHLTEHAKMAYSSLGPDDRRLIDASFEHLQNWRNDDFIRSQSKRLGSDENIYVFRTSTDIRIAFSITDNRLSVLSIFRKEALRTFEALAEHKSQ